MKKVELGESEYKKIYADAMRYRYIKENSKEELIKNFSENSCVDLPHPGCKYVLPEFVSWKEFCGQIEFDEAVDLAMRRKWRRWIMKLSKVAREVAQEICDRYGMCIMSHSKNDEWFNLFNIDSKVSCVVSINNDTITFKMCVNEFFGSFECLPLSSHLVGSGSDLAYERCSKVAEAFEWIDW